MTPKQKRLTEFVIESVYDENVTVKTLDVGQPLGGWTAGFLARVAGQARLLTAIFDGQSLAYFDPKTVDRQELKTDELLNLQVNTDDATPVKRILDWNGFKVGLQYLPFERRHGHTLPAAYGHIQKTRGSDGMALDVYLLPRAMLGQGGRIYVIDQLVNGEFDEEKLVIGAESENEARAIFEQAGKGDLVGKIREITLRELGGYRTTQNTKADASPGKSEIQQRDDADPFVPVPVTLGDIPEFDFGDIDWSEVRSIAEEQGWTYSEDLGRYVDGSGNPVSFDNLLKVTYEELDDLESQIDGLGDELVSGELDVSEWEERMAEIIVATAALFFLFGIGDRNAVTSEHESHLTDRTRTQFEFLRQFSQGIQTGQMTPDGIKAREKLYLHDAELHYSEAQEFAHPVDVWPFYANILGGCVHCLTCPEQTDKGIVSRGSLIPIGQRECKWRCCCQWQFFKTQNERLDSVTMIGRQWGWIGSL